MTPRISLLVAAGALIFAGCSSDDETSPETTNTTAAPVETTAAPTTTGAPSTTAPPTTAAPTTSAPDAVNPEFADWCAVAVDVDALSDQSDLVDYTDPAAVEEYLDELIPALESAAEQAPDEIADAVSTSAEISVQLRDALAAADYDMLLADLSLIDERDDERSAAQEAIRTFNSEQCGIEFDEDDELDDADDDDFSFSDGSLRDQFIGQLVGSGFTEEEAACIFGEMDFSASASMDDPDVLLPIFETCGIDVDRLEEIGTGAAPGLASNDLLSSSLAAIGLDEEQIACVVDEIEAAPPTDVDDELVMSTMLECGVALDQLTDPGVATAGELEDLYIDQFMAMGLDEDGARCLYDELLVGNIDGFSADDVLVAMESCGIDPATLG
ncbi:MAG: hypothetical protein CL424_03960 [Acidimicrobiaceae bacterium]|nr:hypothetical protein [Acidimicrobiaceae bacterium]